jgi:heme exporter protein A
MSFDAVIVEGVSKLYGRQRALSGVSLELAAGRLTALVGPNGAGKSTLVGVLSTLVRPSSGRVRYVGAGKAPTPPEIRGAIGVLAHDSFLYGELDAIENLSFWASLYDVPDATRRALDLLDQVGLEPSARRRPTRTYSRGMLQRVALARALLPQPRLLLLDEPFTGLDKFGVDALAQALAQARRDGRIVLVVTHDLEAIGGLCDHLVVLRGGKVSVNERREAPFQARELRERYYDAPEGKRAST